jgi:AmmeMemoRadiSam system protein B
MPGSGIRQAAVAGSFYEADPLRLRAGLEALLASPVSPRPALAVVVPHAGYVYSGAVAGATFARVTVPRRVIVLAVNHRGRGEPLASWAEGAWRTPLGDLPVDAALVAAVAARAPRLRPDPRAHEREHSLEVQLPFLQLRGPRDLAIAPISIASHRLADLERLGEAVAGAVRASPEPVLVVASTDFSHYIPAAEARRLDELALARIRALDGPGLLATVEEHAISMCGVAPTTAMLVAARALGARPEGVEQVRYANSGDVSGDHESVVGYAGLVVGAA